MSTINTNTTLPVSKKQRISNITIGTHSGTFHADEALAVFLLRLLPQYSEATLVRTRDQDRLNQCDIVVDVGGEYNPTTNRFDHHQRGFDSTFQQGYNTKLSSAGLVYKHFGPSILSTVLSTPSSSPLVATLYPKLYGDFIEAFDGIDNGISAYPLHPSAPLYRSRTDLSSRVSALNPRWNEPTSDEILDQRFERASAMCGQEFLERVDYLAKAWLPAREIVERAVKKRFEVHPSGKIIVFDEFAPWKEHLHLLEQSLSIPSDELPLYVLYAENASVPNSKWRVQAVSTTPEGFESRKPLPESWRGIRDQALSDLSGIEGCVFVHNAGFIGGNETLQGALGMAEKALEE